MKVEYVNPFIEATTSVMKQLLQLEPERGQLSARPECFTTQQVNIVFGVTGQIVGQVLFGMSIVTADKIASKMLGTTVVTFDQLAASAIGELGNMICGNSISVLADAGYRCDITPPTIVRGTNVRISTLDVPALVIPLKLAEMGAFEVNVSLKERLTAKAA
ncbi:MAG TPA: chemotaxis protein CheX [Fimbriimonadaceae bacterium]|nr:chemotaxis protein CheX [Fimbriimonadaceae bacterium]HRJ33594.1 chemotaxis protein CheX [Fimbriimonadaceae bacterium]